MGNYCFGDGRKVPEGEGFKKIRGRLNEHKEAKLLILGVDNSGKTAIFNTIVKKEETDYKDLQPTQGFNTQKIKFDDSSSGDYTLDVWELGGATKIRPFWKKYSKDKDGIIYVIDSADPSRFDESISELKKLLEDP